MSNQLYIDLNCDMGESFGAYSIGNDEAILDYVSSANIACGFHAGDPSVMQRTVALAIKKNVAIGAHPGLQDLQGFGRRTMHIAPSECYDLVLYQIGALAAFVKAQKARLNHVKPHGALYNQAAENRSLADAIAQAVYDYDPSLVLYGLANSELIHAARAKGLKSAAEAFADRSYAPNGRLTPRSDVNALLNSSKDSLNQVLSILNKQQVAATDGSIIKMYAHTICIHGDGPQALVFAKTIRQQLEAAGVIIKKV